MTAYQATHAEHAADLAKAFKVALMVMDIAPEAAGASVQPWGEFIGVVKVGRIFDDTTYAVALHEIGHVVAPTGGLMRERKHLTGSALYSMQLIEERAAWEWARHYAFDWTPAMEQVAVWALSTYEAGYAQALQREQQERDFAAIDAANARANQRPPMKVNMSTTAFAARMGKT